MENRKYLNEEKYQKTEKKLLKLSKIFLIVGVCLSVGIVILGLIITTQRKSNNDIKIEKVDYVADTQEKIKDLKVKLGETQKKFAEETEKLSTKKSELISRGVKKSSDYNSGESYDLYILDSVLDPGYNSCNNDRYSKNELSKEYCSLRNDVEDIEWEIESKEKYISSGRAETETVEKNERLEEEAEWNSTNDKFSIVPFIMFSIPAFMIPGMISFMLFFTAKRRNIMAFSAQQAIPIAKEGIEEIAPSIGKAGANIAKEMAPVYGDIAKEISKGIKEGLKDEEK